MDITVLKEFSLTVLNLTDKKLKMKKVLSLLFILAINTSANAQEQNWFSDIHFCESKDTTVTIAFPNSIVSDSIFTWMYNSNQITYNLDNSITISEPGLYTLELVNTGGVTLTSSFSLIEDAEFYEYFMYLNGEQSSETDTLCLEDGVIISTSQTNETHYWTVDGEIIGEGNLSNNNLTIDSIIDQINFNEEYQYRVSIENTCGIVDAQNEITLLVNECECELNMPNVFSPNGDEFNNTFKPFNDHENKTEEEFEEMCKSTDYKMEIYSQWGRHMASVNSGDKLPSWDGLNKRGNEVAEGVYFYRIVYKMNKHNSPKEKEITGFVHLYRD